jgi:hypothetical protein
LFEKEHTMLLYYLASLRSFTPAVQQRQKEEQDEAHLSLSATSNVSSPTLVADKGGASWQGVIHRALAHSSGPTAKADVRSDPGTLPYLPLLFPTILLIPC